VLGIDVATPSPQDCARPWTASVDKPDLRSAWSEENSDIAAVGFKVSRPVAAAALFV
jgi:hypothetical protein